MSQAAARQREPSWGMDAQATAIELRPATAEDHAYFVRRLDDWWGGRQMAAMLPRLFFTHFPTTTRLAVDTGTDDRLGFLCGFDSQAHDEVAYIHFVGVDPAARGRGVGRQLYEWFFAAARERGRTRVECVTSPVNARSLAFHRAMGFVGVEVRDYDGPGEHRVVLTKDLRT